LNKKYVKLVVIVVIIALALVALVPPNAEFMPKEKRFPYVTFRYYLPY